MLLQLKKRYGKSESSRFVSDPKLQSIVSASAAVRQGLLPSSLSPPILNYTHNSPPKPESICLFS